jgi:hypothetical protein
MESTDQQLSQGFDQFLERQRQVDEAKFAALLAELVEQHPAPRPYAAYSEYSGGICTAQPTATGSPSTTRSATTTSPSGKLNLRHSTTGPTG